MGESSILAFAGATVESEASGASWESGHLALRDGDDAGQREWRLGEARHRQLGVMPHRGAMCKQ